MIKSGFLMEMPPYLCMRRLLAVSSWAVGLYGCPAFANDPSGILPTSGSPEGYPFVKNATSYQPMGIAKEISPENVLASTAGTNEHDGGRFGSMHAMQDLLRFRQSSADGLIEFQYLMYLTHALMLSNVEVAAHDLQRMPLHRFTSPLSPHQIAEVPLGNVGGHRPYHMFVLFTFVEGRTEGIAQDLSNKCRDCSAALVAFREVSKVYKLSGGNIGEKS